MLHMRLTEYVYPPSIHLYQLLSKVFHIEDLGRYMDYGDKPNSQYIIIWTQMNVCEKISTDIKCTPMYQRMIYVDWVVKSIHAQKKRGASWRKRDR